MSEIVHDIIVKVNKDQYKITFHFTPVGYFQDMCIGVRSVLPGEELISKKSTSQTNVRYDENGAQYTKRETTSSDLEVIQNVTAALFNLTQSSITTTSNVGGSAGGGLDLGIISFDFGAEASMNSVMNTFGQTIDSLVTNAVNTTRDTHNITNTGIVNSLHSVSTTTQLAENTTSVYKNTSTTDIATGVK